MAAPVASAIAGVVAAATIAALCLAGEARVIGGTATATDGDSLRVASQRVRLYGIDAPELRQRCDPGPWPCGEVARTMLALMLRGDAEVVCEVRDKDRYSRLVAICRNKGGDLGARMVQNGYALALRRYSTMYVDHEEAAKAERIGIWRGSMVEPAIWRHEHEGERR